jgi:hypothetical protein
MKEYKEKIQNQFILKNMNFESIQLFFLICWIFIYFKKNIYYKIIFINKNF